MSQNEPKEMSPKTIKLLYIFLGVALLLIGAGMALHNLAEAKITAEYEKAVIVAAVGFFFIIVRGRSKQ